MKLSQTLNKTIGDLCRNNFNTAADNHCAHFVCHVLEVDAGYDCKTHKNGSFPGACIRVHELFAVCPDVGGWDSAPEGMKIVFVTDKSNVDLAAHTMRNVPKKHVGIFSEGFVYHYSNTQDLVIRQKPGDFLTRFQGAYGGNQGLFFGTFPAGAKVPELEDGTIPVITAAHAAVAIPQPQIITQQVSPGRNDYFAKLPGVAQYYVGRSTKYGLLRGLAQPSSKLSGPRYAIADYVDEYGTVAGMLGAICMGESTACFNRLNSYDRAAFTFGFYQLAAHTPNDNLILLFRRAVAENAAFRQMFPELKVLDGVLHREVGGHNVSLEKQFPRPGHASEMNLKDFMTFLNADGTAVDDTELSAAARIVHVANTDSAFNDLQVNVAATITMRKLRSAYSVWYNLNGVSDLICTAIADIHHQGRGTKTQVREALASASTVKDKVAALCRIGSSDFDGRKATLKAALAKAVTDGHLGITVFDKASGLFKPNDGWPG
ncbi:MAG TPA: hypothetical protein VNA22_09625 [Pyrinomonadaceae bacterium]|nr:hypothetical protein [Pyrinomonadaceae bacterium]